MAAAAMIQQAILRTLEQAETALSLEDLFREFPNNRRDDVRAAVIPLLYKQTLEFTPDRKFRLRRKLEPSR